MAAALGEGAGGEFRRFQELVDRTGKHKRIEAALTPMTSDDGKRMGAIMAFRDVTEREALRMKIEKAQRLESLGDLAGGIAHDFNNMLTVVVGNLSFLQVDTSLSEEASKIIGNVEGTCWKAQNLSRQLLSFARGNAPVKGWASLEQIVRETSGFLLSGSSVKAEFFVDKALWPVEVDAGQISQVVQNLVVNAKDAMSGVGLLTVEMTNILLEKNASVPLAPGPYIRTRVIDQGTGIPREHVDHIFDLYYTTKPDGNGIGLALVYSIVKRHGGYVEVESSSEKGTVFAFYIPAKPNAAVLAAGDVL
jgi:signal transduction histidine kinase